MPARKNLWRRAGKNYEHDEGKYGGRVMQGAKAQALRDLAAKRGSHMSDVAVELLEKGLRQAAQAERRRGKGRP